MNSSEIIKALRELSDNCSNLERCRDCPIKKTCDETSPYALCMVLADAAYDYGKTGDSNDND